MAGKEVYSLNVKIGVTGDNKAKASIKEVEKTTEKAEKKLKDLDKITASPTAKIRDNASATIDKIQSKTEKLNKTESKIKLTAQDNASSVIDKADGKLKSWLKSGAKKIISIGIAGSLALGGLGVKSAISTFSDFEKGLSNVKAVTQATDTEMQTLKNTAKSLGASTAWSAVQVTQAEELLGQAGFSVKETTSALPGLLSLASAGDLDLAEATDIASGTLRAFNLQASQSAHVADVLALSASATNSDVTDLGETMKYAAPVAQSLGISFEDTAAASGLLSNANIKGSQAGTVLRQTMARLASPTSEAAKVMKKYGINAFDAQGNMKPLSGVIDNLNSSLGKLTSQQRADVISTIFGTESMSGVLALMNQGGESLGTLSQRLKEANGASDKMANTKLDNLTGQWTILKSAVEGMNISLGEKLAPYAKQFVTWLTGEIPNIESKIVSIVDYISSHTGQIKSMAGAFIGVSAAFGTLTAVGSAASSLNNVTKFFSALKTVKSGGEIAKTATGLSKICSLGKLLPAIMSPAGLAITAAVATTAYAVHSYHKLMNESVTTASEDLSVGEKVINKLTGSTIKSKAELKAAGLVYDDFGEGVSENFQNAAKDASKSLLEIEMNLGRLNLADKFDTNAFKNYVNEFTYAGINEIRNRKSEVQSELQKAFSLDGSTSEMESTTLQTISDYYQTGADKELEIRNQIYEIGSKAIENHGKLLDSDMALIKEKLAELNALKLQYANAENEKEQKYASEKFSRDAEKVSGINEASALVQERAKTYNKNTEDIYKTYSDALYDMNAAMKNTTDKSQKTQLQKQISETTKERDKALQKAQKEYQSDLNTLYQAYPNARGKINEETGKAFSKPDLNLQGHKSNIMKEHSALNGINKSGVYTVQNDQTKQLETMTVSVDEKTHQIKAVMNQTTGEVGAYSEEQKNKLQSVAQECAKTSESMRQLAVNQSYLDTSTGNITNKFGDVIGKLQEVKTAANGTRRGLLQLKDGSVVEITCDTDGAITSMSNFNGVIKNTPDDKNVNVTTNADSAAQKIGHVTNEINNMPSSKTITITTVMQQVIKGITEGVATSGIGSSLQNAVSGIKKGYATGTTSATSGIHPVAENEPELVIGKQYRQFKGGETVLNGKETKSLFDGLGKAQTIQPQQKSNTGSTSQIIIPIDININGSSDKEAIIKEAGEKVVQELREAFANSKE